MTPAIEVVIENHVDRHNPVVIEGDGILPSLFDRPSVRARRSNAHIRAVFLHEADEDALWATMRARNVGLVSRAHARKNVRYGEWLKQEAEQRGLPTVPARPWDTLADRVLMASGFPPEASAAPAQRMARNKTPGSRVS